MAAAKEKCISGLLSSIKSIHANLFREMHERCKDGLEPLAPQTKEELENANIYLSKKHLRLYRGAVIADAYPSSFVHWCMENTPTQTILQTQLPDSKETLNVSTSVWQKLVPDLEGNIIMSGVSGNDDVNVKNQQILQTCEYIKGMAFVEKHFVDSTKPPEKSQKQISSKKCSSAKSESTHTKAAPKTQTEAVPKKKKCTDCDTNAKTGPESVSAKTKQEPTFKNTVTDKAHKKERPTAKKVTSCLENKETSENALTKTKIHSKTEKATTATVTKPTKQTHAVSEAKPNKDGARKTEKATPKGKKSKNSSSDARHHVLVVSKSKYEQIEGDIDSAFKEEPLLDSIICIEESSNQNSFNIGRVNPRLLKHKSFNKQLSFARPNKLEEQRHLDTIKIKVYCCKEDIKDDAEHIRNYAIPKSEFGNAMKQFENAVILYKV